MLISVKNLNKTYQTKSGVVHRALNNINLDFEDKGLCFIIGQSGSGKSTLLQILGGLDNYDSGEIVIAGNDLSKLSSKDLDAYRNTMTGFVFQENNLIPSMNTKENVDLALSLQQEKDNGKIEEILDLLGLKDKINAKTTNLSGGQKQRIALARALIKNPRIILADEPTGALDSKTGEEIMGLFKEISKDKLVIVVTHDLNMALKYGDRIIEIRDGIIYRDIMRREESLECVDNNKKDNTTKFYSNTLIHLEKENELSDDEVDKLNNILENSSRKTYLNVDNNKNKMKSLFPNLEEVIKSDKQELKEKEELNSKDFTQHEVKNKEMEKITFKRGKLPISKAVKLGFYNLKNKIGSTIIASLLTMLSLVLLGFSSFLNNYNIAKGYAKTFEKGVGEFKITSSVGTLISLDEFNGSVGKYLDEYSTQYYVSLKTEINLPESNIYNRYMDLYGIIETENITSLGYNVLYGKPNLESFNEIIISSEFANAYKENGSVKSIEELVNKTVEIQGLKLKIVGIFDYLKDEDFIILNFKEKDGFIYAKPGFYNNALKEKGQIVNTVFTEKSSNKTTINSLSRYKIKGDEKKIVLLDGTTLGSVDNIELKSNEIIINNYVSEEFFRIKLPQNYLEYEEDTEKIYLDKIKNFNEDKYKSVYINGKTSRYIIDNVKIKGFVLDKETIEYDDNALESDKNNIIVSDEVYNTIVNQTVLVTTIKVGGFKGDKASKFINAVYDNGYKIEADFLKFYSDVGQVYKMLSTVFLVASIVMFLFTVILLFNYMYNSIRLNQKNTAILRGLGASEKDCIMIHCIEGLIIVLFGCILSYIFLLGVPPLVNQFISISAGSKIFVLLPNIPILCIIPLASIFIVVLATIFAVRKVNKKSIIQAVNKND